MAKENADIIYDTLAELTQKFPHLKFTLFILDETHWEEKDQADVNVGSTIARERVVEYLEKCITKMKMMP